MSRVLGKDVSLEVSIKRMSQLLVDNGFVVEQFDWLNPAPYVWSVQLRDVPCKGLSVKGRGITKQAALASALGAFIEHLGCNYFFARSYLGKQGADSSFIYYPNERWFSVDSDNIPAGLLDEATLSHYNMDDNLKAHMLLDFNSDDVSRGVCGLPFVHQKTAREVWFPVKIIDTLYVGNGSAAGNNKFEARVHALSEIFERHIKNTILSSGISLPRIPPVVVERYPDAVAIINLLRELGYIVYVLDASLGGKFPLVGMTIFDPEDGGCFAAFGAHPKFEIALLRVASKVMQRVTLDPDKAFPEPVFDLQKVADQGNLEAHSFYSNGVISWDLLSTDSDYAFTEWNVDGDSEAEFEHLCHLIHRVDMDIYIADYEYLGLYVCRVIVPGMSDVYPVDRLVVSNDSAMVELRSVVFDLNAASDGELSSLLNLIEDGAFGEADNVAALLGVFPDKESYFNELSVAELKCLICLKLGRLVMAAKACHSIKRLSNRNSIKLFRCLSQLLALNEQHEIQLDEVKMVFIDVYGEAVFSRCQAMLAGSRVFEDLHVIDDNVQCFKSHSAMLAVYSRLKRLKSAKSL